MKKISLIGLLVLAGLLSAYSQKYAFVDTDYILQNIPTYNAAQSQLDEQSKVYQDEVQALYNEIEKLWKNYQAEKVLLTEEKRNEMEEAIVITSYSIHYTKLYENPPGI